VNAHCKHCAMYGEAVMLTVSHLDLAHSLCCRIMSWFYAKRRQIIVSA